MLSPLRCAVFVILFTLICAPASLTQSSLNPGGEARYGRQSLAPGFEPSPFTIDVVSGGEVAIKPLALGDNCLGYAAADPDFVVELAAGFERVTFLIASAEDTTLIINLPNGSWSCNDDTNGLNPALVYYNAAPGSYQVWIGSFAAETFDDAVLYLAETGPEALPTTATGPDPAATRSTARSRFPAASSHRPTPCKCLAADAAMRRNISPTQPVTATSPKRRTTACIWPKICQICALQSTARQR